MSCNGDHLVQQGSIKDTPELLPCNICSKLAPDDFKKGVFDNEKKHCVEKVADLGVPGDVANSILALQPPHPQHGTALTALVQCQIGALGTHGEIAAGHSFATIAGQLSTTITWRPLLRSTHRFWMRAVGRFVGKRKRHAGL